MSSVAIVQTAFIGDVVLATPLIEAARVSNPGTEVLCVVRAGCDTLLGNNPHVDEVIVWDKHGRDRGLRGIVRVARRLREKRAATVLVPHRSIRSSLAAFFSGAGTRVGFSKGGGALLHTARVPWRTGIHEVERNLMLAREAGWLWEGFRPAVFPDDRDRTIVDDITAGMERFCVLAPGSVWPTKMWPAEFHAETGRMFAERGLRVVLSGGTDDAHVCGLIAGLVPGSLDTCGLLTLRQSAELYRRAEFVLTGDTAPQHIAAAMGTRVFALFGPTVRDFGFTPYSDRGVVIEESMDCRPCGMHGHRSCPDGHHACMRRITPDRVAEVIRGRIGDV